MKVHRELKLNNTSLHSTVALIAQWVKQQSGHGGPPKMRVQIALDKTTLHCSLRREKIKYKNTNVCTSTRVHKFSVKQY